ncbi:hypothetical protein FRC12_023440 [Ceratobasidium sp. 428]|nr:hypothetical protein FRC12_023440 [Ceratobasidium sp. 428]
MREPCADCRGRKRRCIHHSDLGKDDAPGTDVDGPDESMRTDHESDVHPRSHSPHSPPRWPPHPPYYAAPPPPPPAFSGYPHNEHRMNYTAHPAGPGQLMHPHEHAYTHPPHPHGLHPSHAHPRLPPAPDMRHPIPGGPSCKECRARGVPCTCPETRADDGGANADGVPAPPAAPGAKGATPAPAPPAGRKGRACLACRKLKMRCVAPNGDNGNANPDGPDERCQRCERAGLECIYVDRKRRGPGAVFGVQTDGSQPTTGSFEGFNQNGQNASQNPGANANQNQAPTNPNQNGAPNGINGTTTSPDGLVRPNTPSQRPPAKKLKREGSPRTSSPYPNAGGVRRIAPGPGEDALMHLVTVDDIRMQRVMGEDAARTLEESFADDDEDEDSSSR